MMPLNVQINGGVSAHARLVKDFTAIWGRDFVQDKSGPDKCSSKFEAQFVP